MRAAVLWTGGKDSALALYRAAERDAAEISSLVTFVPADRAAFHAHPLEQMAEQARQLSLEQQIYPISEPYRDAYVKALSEIKSVLAVDSIVTGDIDYVDGFPNWVRECSVAAGFEVSTPLWHASREGLLHELVKRGIRARISWIKQDALPKSWLGRLRLIDESFILDIIEFHERTGVDICGENGEYHTMCEFLPPLLKSSR